MGLVTKKDVMDELAKLIPEDVPEEVGLGPPPPPPPPAGDPPDIFLSRPLVIAGRILADTETLDDAKKHNIVYALKHRKPLKKVPDDEKPTFEKKNTEL